MLKLNTWDNTKFEVWWIEVNSVTLRTMVFFIQSEMISVFWVGQKDQ